MPPIYFVIPGDLNSRTGGTIYDKRIIEGLRSLGQFVEVVTLGGNFPFPSAAEKESAGRVFTGLPDNTVCVVDGLAFGALPEAAERHGDRLIFIALVHHPLALETGLAETDKQRFLDSEKRALRMAQGVITTSAHTADDLQPYGVMGERLCVCTPGVDPAPQAAGSQTESANLLCVATLTPRKGHDTLIKSLAVLRNRSWQLTCAGSMDRSPYTTKLIRDLIGEMDLGDRVHLTGECSEADLSNYYHRSDLFVLASHYEGYGMVLAEALVRGIPVITTAAGAIRDTVPQKAGVLVPPGDQDAFTAALSSYFDNGAMRRSLVAGAQASRESFPTWGEAAATFLNALRRFAEI